jgi:hypothetical protein
MTPGEDSIIVLARMSEASAGAFGEGSTHKLTRHREGSRGMSDPPSSGGRFEPMISRPRRAWDRTSVSSTPRTRASSSGCSSSRPSSLSTLRCGQEGLLRLLRGVELPCLGQDRKCSSLNRAHIFIVVLHLTNGVLLGSLAHHVQSEYRYGNS